MCTTRDKTVSPGRVHHGYDPCIQVEGHGPPLVLVPGLDGTGRLFYQQVPRLAQRFRVARYTLRDAARTMEPLVDDLAAVIHTVAPQGEPVTLIGESFGGTLAMSFALARPDMVSALVVLNSFPYFLPQHRLHLAIAGLRVMPWGAMRLVRRLTAFRVHSRHTHRADLQRFLAETRQTTRVGYLNRLRVLTRVDLRERLRDIRVPTLFLAADQDHLVPSVAQGTYMAARVPDATLRILHGHGHICLIAQNLDLERILAAWGH